MTNQNDYLARIVWTGNRGKGTASYKAYDRSWDMALPGKEVVHCSNDPFLGGDPGKYNPEDLLVTALSSCHMLWYLHLCSVNNITVTSYEDNPVGIGESAPDGSGNFVEAILRPTIYVTANSVVAKAIELHDEIHKYCFIARSVNFPVRIEAEVLLENTA